MRIGVGAAVCAVACVAYATESVDAQLDRALSLFDAGDAAGALAVIEAAEAQASANDVILMQFIKARCFIELNRPDDAKAALERYIAGSKSAKAKARGRRWMAKINRRFYGAIRVACTDATKRLTLKSRRGAQAQRCPAQWDDLSPGRYTVVDGAARVAIEVTAGKLTTLDLDGKTQKVGDLPAEPTPVRFGWGGFARAGGSLGEGTIDASAETQVGAAVGAGAFADLIWQFDALDLGVRAELGYRAWQLAIEGDGRSSDVDTHGLIVPVLGVIGGWGGVSAEAGLAAEYLFAGPDAVDTRLAVHLAGGLSWELPVAWGRPRLSARYLREVVEGLDPALDLRRQSITAGVAFGL